MWPAFPTSDYYDGSAPSRPDQSAVRPIPATHLAGAVVERRPGWFPCSLLFARRRRCPTLPLRHRHELRRRPSPWPPGRRCKPSRRVPRPPRNQRNDQVRTAPGPDPPGSSRCRLLRGVTTPVPRVLPFRLARRTRRHLAVPDTSRLCQGCSHPPRRPPGSAAPSFTPPLRRSSGEVGVGPGRGTGLVTSPFPRPALRTGRATLTASGAPRTPSGTARLTPSRPSSTVSGCCSPASDTG